MKDITTIVLSKSIMFTCAGMEFWHYDKVDTQVGFV